MLVASLGGFERPRIISEVRKPAATPPPPPKLTGELLVKSGVSGPWRPRRAQISSGQLLLSGRQDGDAPAKLALRHLSLRPGPLPHCLALCRDQNVVLALQTSNEAQFDVWVRSIAIELIRQTPLDAVKYLDIFNLAKCWQQQKRQPKCAVDSDSSGTCDERKDWGAAEEGERRPEDEVNLEALLSKCQNSDSYVPVKEKLLLFESLGRMGRKVRSTEDVSCRSRALAPHGCRQRARSMHDLTNLNTVREICKYFEMKTDANNNKT